MINYGLILKKQDPIQKIKIDDTTYTKTKDTKFLTRLFESKVYLIFYVIFTIYALFGDDFRQLFVPIRYDNFCYFLMSLTCIFFIADIIMSSIYSSLYRFSVLFFMDIISVCFLFFDIGPINQLFFNRMSMNVYGVLARGARAVSIGYLIYRQKQKYYVTRYGNNIKQQQQSRKQRRNANLFVPTSIDSLNPDEFQTAPYNSQLVSENNIIYIDKNKKPIDKSQFLQRTKSLNQQLGEKQVIEQVESTSQQLTRSFQIKIILGMFILIYLLPIFWTHTYFNKLSSYKIGINHLTQYIDVFEMDEEFNLIWQKYVDLCSDVSDHYEFIKLELYLKNEEGQFELIKQEGDLKQLDQIKKEYRYYELVVYTSKDQTEIIVGQHYIKGIWQKRKKVNLDSWLSICRTIFFLFIIITLGIFMSKDINDYFAVPFFNLMSKVNMIHANPMDAWHQFEDDSQELVKNKKYTEIDLLRRSLVESSKLLQIGLGEAGNEVVIQNLKFNAILDNSQISLKNDLKAKKIYSIFGFVYINKFQEQTEILLEDVFDFVNSIANIVHQNVQKLKGNINKNIGEAFLIVWKIKNQHADIIENVNQIYDEGDIPYDLKSQVENSIYAFIKIILEFQLKAPHKKFHKIQQKFKSLNKLSLGLHLGWAIEGAIGSKHKIDVSYLSPHVNLASRVTAVTMQYRVPLLMSNEVVKFVSQKYKKYMRKIDRVFLKGSKKGILLYTFDMNLSSQCIQIIQTNKLFQNDFQFDQFINSVCLKKLKSIYSITFQDNWKQGFEYYQNGQWKKAKKNLSKCLKQIGNDGPTLNLYKFMSKQNFKVPHNWNGIRSLLKKQIIFKKIKLIFFQQEYSIQNILLYHLQFNYIKCLFLIRSLQYLKAQS